MAELVDALDPKSNSRNTVRVRFSFAHQKMKKNIIFKSFIIISIFLIYITFKSEITWKGTRREYYSVYQYFFILIILFSILSLFISENLKNYILVTFFSFVFSIYLFETFFFNYAELRDQKKK